jgi:tRNA A-37 threonylcarbamoyl transferase component Bud32
MPTVSDLIRQLPSADWDCLQQFLAEFEQELGRGRRPDVREVLSRRPPRLPTLALLVELVHLDLEHRLKAGEPARVEAYLQAHPDLIADPDLVLELILAEHRFRLRAEPRLGAEEYLRRFPQHRAALEVRLRPAPPAPAVARPVDSVAALGQALRDSRLLEPAQLQELTALQARYVEPRGLARELLQRDWLTAYQVNQLFQGRGHELTLGPYVLLERLGAGGMGQVFKARHVLMRRLVALKVIRKDHLADPEIVSRFHREIRAVAQLAHPNIVLAHDAGQVGDTHFLVMEYVEGTDLARLVKKHGPLPVARACAYVRQAALGLQHAHERGLVHRDIKPANLLLATAPGEAVVKVLDLGLARLSHGGEQTVGELTQEGAVMGTPDFIAPEQAEESRGVDIRADVYSLGCTLYYLLTGRVPFPGGTLLQKLRRHQNEQPAPVTTLRPEVPAQVAARS